MEKVDCNNCTLFEENKCVRGNKVFPEVCAEMELTRSAWEKLAQKAEEENNLGLALSYRKNKN